MKKLFYAIALVLIASLSFNACKEQPKTEEPAEEIQSQENEVKMQVDSVNVKTDSSEIQTNEDLKAKIEENNSQNG